MTATKRFTLTLTIEGDSLEEVDDCLVRAGGERLMCRMTDPPQINFKGEPHAKTKIEVKENGRPKKIDQEKVEVRALRSLYEKCGEEAVIECLGKFAVKKASELGDTQIEPFIQYINSKLEDANANQS